MNLVTRYLIGSRFLSTLTFQMLSFYGFYTIFKTTGSPLLTGSLGLALYLPTLFLSFAGGFWTDRIINIGLSYSLIQFIQIVVTLILIFCPNNYFTVFTSIVLISIIRSLRSPLYYSLLGQLKNNSKETMSSTSLAKLNSLSWQLPLIIGPALLSLIMDNSERALGLGMIMLIQTASFAFTIPSMSHKKLAPDLSKSSHPSVLVYLKKIHKNKELMFPLYGDALLASFLGLSAFLPFYMKSISINPSHFGYIKSLFHFTALFATLVIPIKFLSTFDLKGFSKLLVLWSIAIGSLALSKSFTGLLITIGTLGFLDGFSALYRENLIFTYVHPNEMGRMSSINSFLISSGDELGEFNTGWLMHEAGNGFYLVLNSIIGLVVSAFIYRASTSSQLLGAHQVRSSTQTLTLNRLEKET